MKNLILAGILFLGLTHSFGQFETLDFRNDPPIINPLTQAPIVGADGMRAALYWAPSVDPNNFTQLGNSVAVGYLLVPAAATPGIFQGTSGTRPGPPGTDTFFTARGWELAYGATYEAAAAAPAMNGRTALLFTCNTLQYPPSGGGQNFGPEPPDLLFQCAMVPEPTTVTLILLGGAAFLFSLHRKRGAQSL